MSGSPVAPAMSAPTSTATAIVLLLVAASLAGCFHSTPPSASNDLVSSTKYAKLFVEVDYVEGFKARAATIDLLKVRIQERLSKPGGTTVEETAFKSTKSVYTNSDLRELETQHRQHQPGGDTMVLYVLVINGHHSEDTSNGKVLGVQYGRASIAIFKESIDSSGGLFGINFGAADVEKAVLVHEFGHAVGLVNNGMPMVNNHEDAGHPKHSSNKNSVMYWAVENTLGLPGLDNVPNQFDAEDIRDIQKAGGK